MVKTRFAPSPTGYLHLGNARTAIFSYLFARHNGGSFILRIEDTDRERSRKEYEEALLRDLEWLGIEWDEFYRQSERLGIYRRYGEELLKKGYAYPCFCTPEELAKEREKARKEGRAYRYSGKCRDLEPERVAELKEMGKPFVLRFRVPDGENVVFEDIVKGHVSINVDDFGDFVIIRSDGTPTYNFVVVVDDALMGITHVIRGEDHLPNTPKQILIYRALGFKIPEFAHLPVILGEDRSKLSKRHGAVSVVNYREEGFLPEALFNYLCLLGWSPPKTDREVFTKEELISIFDLRDVNFAPAVFSKEKLRWMNGVYIREVLSSRELLKRALPFLKKAGYDVSDEDYVLKVIERTKDAYATLGEMVQKLRPFFIDEIEIDPEAKEKLSGMRWRESLRLFLEKASSEEDLKAVAKEVQKELGIKAKEVWLPLRVALTGKLEGVGVDVLLSTLPKDRVLRRIERFLAV